MKRLANRRAADFPSVKFLCSHNLSSINRQTRRKRDVATGKFHVRRTAVCYSLRSVRKSEKLLSFSLDAFSCQFSERNTLGCSFLIRRRAQFDFERQRLKLCGFLSRCKLSCR